MNVPRRTGEMLQRFLGASEPNADDWSRRRTIFRLSDAAAVHAFIYIALINYYIIVYYRQTLYTYISFYYVITLFVFYRFTAKNRYKARIQRVGRRFKAKPFLTDLIIEQNKVHLLYPTSVSIATLMVSYSHFVTSHVQTTLAFSPYVANNCAISILFSFFF